MKLLSLEETAERLTLSPRSLADWRYRARLGLPAVKLGRKVVFEEDAVEQLIIRGREPGHAPEGKT